MNPIREYIKTVSTVIIDGTEYQRIGTIESITMNDGIYPYYERFLQAELPNGLYVIDNQRWYSPIDSGHFGLHHLVSVPREFPPLYGLTRYKFSKIFYSERYIIIFVGCVGLHGRHRFLSQIKTSPSGTSSDKQLCLEDYNVIPCPGVKPEIEMNYLMSVEEAESSSDDYEEEEEAEWNC